MDYEGYDDEIRELETVRGGRRQYPDGPLFFVTFGDGMEQERVTLSSKDGAGLALALRRAADEIEGVRQGPFNLPPVLETLDEYAARTGA
jgi:hypothetical protein